MEEKDNLRKDRKRLIWRSAIRQSWKKWRGQKNLKTKSGGKNKQTKIRRQARGEKIGNKKRKNTKARQCE